MPVWIRIFFAVALTIFSTAIFAAEKQNIAILCYHNFSPTTPGSMNLKPQRLEEQLQYLKDNGYTIIPLKEAVAYLQGKRDSLPAKPIVITVDDGWKSVHTYLLPIVKKHQIPVTLFIYPSTISSGKNAMTWEELKELQQTGLFDIQSHTWDHPNFKQAKRRMSSEKYSNYVTMQLVKSKKMLEEKMGTDISYLAWPFGIYDAYLEQKAAEAGYEMAFTIDYKPANRGLRKEAQPRFMIIEAQSMNTFKGIVGSARQTSSR